MSNDVNKLRIGKDLVHEAYTQRITRRLLSKPRLALRNHIVRKFRLDVVYYFRACIFWLQNIRLPALPYFQVNRGSTSIASWECSASMRLRKLVPERGDPMMIIGDFKCLSILSSFFSHPNLLS